MNCVIIEDNEVQQHIISEFVNITENLNLIGVYTSVVDIMGKLNNLLEVDVLFLDVELPEMTGIEFLEKFNPSVNVILITANEGYAVDAFNNDVIDYLVKPINYPRFLYAVNKLKPIDKIKESIFIKSNGELVKLILEEVLWVKSASEYLIIYTESKKHMVYSSMIDFLERLPNTFIQVHRSHIVNFKKIESYSNNLLKINEHFIKVSKTYVKKVIEIMKS